MNKKIVFVLLALGGQLSAGATPLKSLDTEALSDSSKVVDLDEVVVVSQPKEQVRLRLQPVSSNVFGSEQLQQLNVRDLSQLSQYVPSFVMPSYGSRLTSSMYVRGIGSRINNPAVGVYYDNIPLMSKSAFNNHFYMLDRVDVLRGPQGTLYGQNTEGGLVRIYSKNPMNYQGTDIRLGIGTGLYSNVEVAHYHRPSEKFAFSVAGFYSGLKGFINNQNFDKKNDLTNEAGGKLRLMYAPTKKLTFDWTADYQYVNQNGFGYGELNLDNNKVTDPSTTIMNGYKRNMLNTGLNISYNTDQFLFTSTTSYQFLEDLMQMDQDYMAGDYLRLEQRQKMNALTQEFVLRNHGTSRWQHTTGLFGSYQWMRTDAPVFFGEGITAPIGNAIATAMKNSMIKGMLGRFMAQGMTAEQAQTAAEAAVEKMGVTMTAEMAVPGLYRTPQMSLGLYHESNILITDRLKATVGLRLAHDWAKIEYDALAYMNMTGGTASATATYHLTSHIADNRSKSFTQLLPKFALTYSFDENIGNIYALVSKGYRAGGYNFQMFSDILQTDLNAHQQDAMRGDYDVEHTAADYDAIEETTQYKPEESWNYELGTHLNLFGGSTHFDLALYFMQLRNQQLSVMMPGSNYGRIMVNAGKSHSCGVEATLRGRAFDNALDWSVTYAFTNAKFDDYKLSLGIDKSGLATDNFGYSYDGNYVPFVPQHAFSTMADWHIGKFTIGANVAGQGKTWWDEGNSFAQKFYATVGAHADYDFGPVVVTLWGRNLTDTKYNTFAIASSAVGGTHYFAQKANPIQVGLDVNIHL
ncbi:TonB-dependent receptor [Xylanibacter ruminicola]|uniref:Outer membrane receptor proteins, mostly Fe transport n=1 Tax=Xylanibacter ruminicola TaxID=839 RepID=A0A1M6R0N9_XYLRU|nr:TonB-dependent receptor [Xylanibacter ruminicola]SHK25918.1 Outer membrane receptor proteins, mostly Fe transport [Xylanibacter ruminicola]